MIKVLHVVSSLGSGGVGHLLLNYYKNMDRNKIKFDFIVHTKERGILEPIFESYNSSIYHVPSKHESFFGNLKSIKEIIANGNYNVVHAHQGIMSFFPIYYAKKAGVKKRIAHSHEARTTTNISKKLIHNILKPFLKRYSNYWFACGIDAGKILWGEDALKNGQVYIMKNAIDIKRFKFCSDVREKKRKELGIEKEFVIGNVGRFEYPKNHEYLIKIFNEVYKKYKNAVLLLIGDGQLEGVVKKQVENYGLTDAVKFLGVRNDVNELLQAMDIFLLPSRWEGLPVVLVEAQAAGLKSLVSDTVTMEVKCTNLLEYISLEKSPQYWANEILKYKNGYERISRIGQLSEAGYNIQDEVKKMEKFYCEICNN